MTINTTKIINKKYQKLKNEYMRLNNENRELRKQIVKLQRQNAKNKIAAFIIREEQKATKNEFAKRINHLPPSQTDGRNIAWEDIKKSKQFYKPA